MSRRILIKPNNCHGHTELLSISLPHPQTGVPTRFFMQNGNLYEMQLVDCGGERSWFIENNVQQDGTLYLTTIIDPIFVLLPILDSRRKKTTESEGKYLELDEILESYEYPALSKLRSLKNIETFIEWICDIQDYKFRDKVYRLNDVKVIEWLKAKISSLVTRFDDFDSLDKLIKLGEGDSLNIELKKDLKVRSAIEILSEYLTSSWLKMLTEHYNFERIEVFEDSQARINNKPVDYYAKQSKRKETNLKKEQPMKKQKLTRAQTTLAKANTKGMQKMTLYFTKIPKEAANN
ncbi:hypothetical protein G9A89_004678 [Geosiphon pyriformis]|nr:hypothetical protein G9A89_004678 [Geosiphon pyriformis]